MDICMIHFAPGAKLHQTLTYKADVKYTWLGKHLMKVEDVDVEKMKVDLRESVLYVYYHLLYMGREDLQHVTTM